MTFSIELKVYCRVYEILVDHSQLISYIAWLIEEELCRLTMVHPSEVVIGSRHSQKWRKLRVVQWSIWPKWID